MVNPNTNPGQSRLFYDRPMTEAEITEELRRQTIEEAQEDRQEATMLGLNDQSYARYKSLCKNPNISSQQAWMIATGGSEGDYDRQIEKYQSEQRRQASQKAIAELRASGGLAFMEGKKRDIDDSHPPSNPDELLRQLKELYSEESNTEIR
jgi:hypothetical protein